MIKEFSNESQAKAIAESLGLIITKYRGIYIVSNSKEEIIANYNLGSYPEGNAFYDRKMFKIDEDGFLVIKDKEIVDASSVELPYNIKDCSYMFYGCSLLEISPKIPEGVKECCYMFMNCTSLKEPPVIPRSVINCLYMFHSCSSLEASPIIPESVKNCGRMFYGCISLKEPPHFPKNCYTIDALQGTPFERS